MMAHDPRRYSLICNYIVGYQIYILLHFIIFDDSRIYLTIFYDMYDIKRYRAKLYDIQLYSSYRMILHDIYNDIQWYRTISYDIQCYSMISDDTLWHCMIFMIFNDIARSRSSMIFNDFLWYLIIFDNVALFQ